MARIQLKIWHAPLAVLSSPPPVGLAEGEVAIALETNSFVKRPDGDDAAPLVTLNGDSNFIRVRAATVGANIALSGLQTIDGVFLNAGELVLVKDQEDARQNGFYSASVGAWPRASRADSVASLASSLAIIETGTVNGDSLWLCTVDRDAGSIGSAAIEFVQPAGGAGGGGGGAVTPEDIGAVPMTAVGQADGVASLDGTGKIPAVQLPSASSMGALSSTLLGAANGIAQLGADGKVPASQLPASAAGGNANFYEMTVQFAGSNPGSVSGLPAGWSAVIAGSDVTITHNVGSALKTIQYWGVSTVGGLERYRLPSASNEASIPLANRTTKFTFRITTAVSGADADGTARVVVGF